MSIFLIRAIFRKNSTTKTCENDIYKFKKTKFK
jgi:hypothetical protein